MSALSIGISGMQVGQKLLDITGQNIANASNPAYHRQVADLAALDVGNPLGAGVTITGVRRERNDLIETALTRNTSDVQSATSQLDALRQVEAYLTTGAGGIDTQLSSFFNGVQQLAADPGNVAQRQVVVNTAANLAQTLNSTSDALRQLSGSLDSQAASVVGNINTDARQIADLNGQIQQATAAGQQPNGLLDQRDGLVNQLAQLVNVQVVPTNFNQVNVIAAGAPVVVGTQSLGLQYSNSGGQAVLVRADQTSQGLNATSGQAAGLLQIRNGDLPTIRGQLDTLAQALAQGVDEVQATGLGLGGPLTSTAGGRGVTNPAAPLNAAGLTFPPQAGTLTVSVTDPSGARTVHTINIDPTGKTAGAAASLNDLAAALSGIQVGPAGSPTTPLTASVDTTNNTLKIVAANGYGFDFAGRLPSAPANVTGAISAQLSGQYTGTANDAYTYTVAGSGAVGQSANLTLNVADGKGNLLGSFNIGQGYTPGAALGAVNGVAVSVAAGTLSGGESFQAPVTANPDSANVLTALGVNTFFTGDSAATLAVQPGLLQNPQQLSGSRNGDSGDGSNFTKIVNLQNAPTLSGGTQTLSQYYASTVGSVGVRVQDLSGQQTAKQALGQQLSAQQQSVSGVDPNEELVNLLQYQRSFQMASEYINVVNQTMTTLLGLIPIR